MINTPLRQHVTKNVQFPREGPSSACTAVCARHVTYSARAQHTTHHTAAVLRTTHRTTELPEGCAAMTRADATCNARRCNAQRKRMQHATRTDATCNHCSCNVQLVPLQACNTRGSQRFSCRDTGMMCRNKCEEAMVNAPQRATHDATQHQASCTHRSACTALCARHVL